MRHPRRKRPGNLPTKTIKSNLMIDKTNKNTRMIIMNSKIINQTTKITKRKKSKHHNRNKRKNMLAGKNRKSNHKRALKINKHRRRGLLSRVDRHLNSSL